MLPGDSSYVAQLLSNERMGGSSWLICTAPHSGPLVRLWDRGDFIESLKNQLCIPLFPESPDLVYICECSKRVVLGTDDHHFSSCKLANTLSNNRHNKAVQYVEDAVKKAWGPAASITREYKVQRESLATRERTFDFSSITPNFGSTSRSSILALGRHAAQVAYF